MKWYFVVLITMGVFLLAYLFMKLNAKTNVYYNIETEPSKPVKKNENTACGNGTSFLNDESLPLGFRNNNPLNLIKSSNAWKGKIKDAPGRFEQFCSMEYGTRAAMINLRTYINRYGRNSIRKIITKWAPASENPTNAYIDFVVRQTGYAPDTPITFQKATIFNLVDAMSQMENGAGMDVENVVKEKAWSLI